MNPPTLTALLKLKGTPQFGSEKCSPPKWVLDLKADLTITAGYTRKKNPTCTVCFERKSISGSCSCS
jgi:hypothetical protein